MIVEIAGVKVEVDERTARTVEQYRVGDRVKVLTKSYGETYRIHPGVIVGFAAFKALPSIEVMYLDVDKFASEPVKFLTLNAKTDDVELAPLGEDELILDREDVLARIDDEIRKRRDSLDEMERKRAHFVKRFSEAFPGEFAPEAKQATT